MSSRLVANTVPKMLLRVSATHVTVLQLKLHPRLRHFQWLAVLATRWKQLPPPTNNVFVRPACHHVIVQFQNHMHVISCTAYSATSTAKMLASSCSLFSIHCLRCSWPFAAHPSLHCLRHTAFATQSSTSNATGNTVVEGRYGRIYSKSHEASSAKHLRKTRCQPCENYRLIGKT